jgi:Uma2 family endonuclease
MRNHYTYGDYLTWPDEFRVELIDGECCVREPPAPSRIHQEIVGGLYVQVSAALEGKPAYVYFGPFDVRLPKSDETDKKAGTVVQPDLFVVCDEHKLDDRGVRGAPDWVVEVLSPSNLRHDKVVKLAVYERAGVREYWLVHPGKRKLTIYQLEDGCYGPANVLDLKGRVPITAVPGLSIDWDRLLLRLT